MESKNALSIIEQFPETKFNLLIPIKTVTEIADIQRPVMNTVFISTKPEDKEIYLQDKKKSDSDGWTITSLGLEKLMAAAGISVVYSRSVPPSTCMKCAEMNKTIGKPVNCSKCGNKDVKYECCIQVPNLTGVNTQLIGEKEIIFDDFTATMSEAQKREFTKHRSEHCATRALNRALRKAMLIKSTYSLKELEKPFVVAYLVPNLENPDVKQAALSNMFKSSNMLFGSAPEIQQIENEIHDQSANEANGRERINRLTDETYQETAEVVGEQDSEIVVESEERSRTEDFICDKCGEQISEKVWNYSVDHYSRPLCYKCQKLERGNG